MNAVMVKNLRKLAGWFRLYNGMLPEARENCACVLEDAANALEIPSFNYKDCEIPENEDGVHLWYVQGIKGKWYPTKIVAEQAARSTFPEDTNYYARVYYCTFLGEK